MLYILIVLKQSKFSSVCPLGSREDVLEKMETLTKLFKEINEVSMMISKDCLFFFRMGTVISAVVIRPHKQN